VFHLIVALVLVTAEGDGASEAVAETTQARWIRYRVTPGEYIVDVAARFGVSAESLREWNDMDSRRRRLRPGQRLKIHTRKDPPPRQRISYTVQRGETWQDVAVRHGIDSRRLRAYNWRQERLHEGDEIVIWLDPGQPQTVREGANLELPHWEPVASGAESVGRPQMGRIHGTVRLPESPLYDLARPNWSWGSTHALFNLQLAIATFRRDSGYAGPVVIGSISRRGGRAFPPHSSHQSGRDVDIRLPLRPGMGDSKNPRADEIDWPAAWRLVDALIATGEVQVIFLERPLQRRLYEAALRAGESERRLSGLIEWADDRRWSHAIVRHAGGHDGHIHVRFACGPVEKRCK
jgi:murein endopeptidase/LysM repeat protein